MPRISRGVGGGSHTVTDVRDSKSREFAAIGRESRDVAVKKTDTSTARRWVKLSRSPPWPWRRHARRLHAPGHLGRSRLFLPPVRGPAARQPALFTGCGCEVGATCQTWSWRPCTVQSSAAHPPAQGRGAKKRTQRPDDWDRVGCGGRLGPALGEPGCDIWRFRGLLGP